MEPAKPSRNNLGPPYRDVYCRKLIDFMSQGYSLTAFAGEIGASPADFERWCARHPRFADAVQRGQARRARLLEDRLLTARGLNAVGAHMKALKAVAPGEWGGKASAPPPARTRPPPPAAALDLPDNGRD